MERFTQRAILIVGVILLIPYFAMIGFSLWAAQEWFPLVGRVFMFDILFCELAFPFLVVGLVMWFITRSRFYSVGQYGGWLERFGRVKPLKPLLPEAIATTPKLDNLETVRELYNHGMDTKAIAKQTGITPANVKRMIAEYVPDIPVELNGNKRD